MEPPVLIKSPNIGHILWETRHESGDVIIVCHDQVQVRAHQIVLDASSAIFKQHQLQLTDVNVEVEDLDQEINGEELELMLEFIYKGEVEVPAEKYQRFCQISKSLSTRGLHIAQVEGGITSDEISNEINDQEGSPLETLQSETAEELAGSATLPSRNICMLPIEIITKILSHMSTYDLLQNVALLSKQFYGLVKSPSVHLVVSFSMFVEKLPAVKFLEQMTSMRELHIHRPQYYCWNSISVNFIDTHCDRFLSAIKEHQHLRVLISSSVVSTECFLTLSESKWWPNLNKLVILIHQEDGDLIPLDLPSKMKLDSALLSLAMSENLRHLSLSTSLEGGLFNRNAYTENFNPNLMWKNLKVLISSDPVFYPEKLSIKPEKIEVLELSFVVKHNLIYNQLHEMKKLRVLSLVEFVYPDNAAEIASRIIPGSFTQLETIRLGMPTFKTERNKTSELVIGIIKASTNLKKF